MARKHENESGNKKEVKSRPKCTCAPVVVRQDGVKLSENKKKLRKKCEFNRKRKADLVSSLDTLEEPGEPGRVR